MASNNRDHSCLVIGGGGYIGSFLVPLLIASGRFVTVLGRRAEPCTVLPEGACYVQGCFSDPVLIRRLLDDHHEVIHLAYATVPNTSFDNPLSDLLENLPPTVQLFAEAAIRGNRLILVSSGGTVYGEAITLPITEEHPTRPISPYGVTKLTLEKYAFLYAKTHGLQVICLRPGNAYGEGQRPFMGQGFIATAIASAIIGKPITIFGKKGGIRDYIHVADLASGILKGLEYGEAGRTYNLGSGDGLSNMDIISYLKPLLAHQGYDIELSRQKARGFDVLINILDGTALREKTGWLPRINFEIGLERTVTWMVAHCREEFSKLGDHG
jgi:UDP-glucose 4-epimerase